MAKKNILPIAFVHSADFDGMCSAALLNKYFNNQIEVHPINYGDKELRSDTAFLDAFDVKGRDVYICDFSLKPNLMKKVIDLSNMTVWLDHHASAVSDIISSPWYRRGIKTLLKGEEAKDFCKLTGFWLADENLPYSGAYLTWAWLFNDKNPGFLAHETLDEDGNVIRTYEVIPVAGNLELGGISTPNVSQAWLDCPQAIKNISAFDTWKKEFVVDADVFQYGMKALGFGLDTPALWEALLADPEKDEYVSYDVLSLKQKIEQEIEVFGKVVMNYNKSYMFPRIDRAAYTIKLKVNGKNLKGLALNVNGFNSEVFEPMYDPEKHDFFMAYYYNKDHWSYSVYVPEDKLEKVSAIDIVRSFDPEKGGGHRGSAGGNSDKLLKELQK